MKFDKEAFAVNSIMSTRKYQLTAGPHPSARHVKKANKTIRCQKVLLVMVANGCLIEAKGISS